MISSVGINLPFIYWVLSQSIVGIPVLAKQHFTEWHFGVLNTAHFASSLLLGKTIAKRFILADGTTTDCIMIVALFNRQWISPHKIRQVCSVSFRSL